MGAPSGVDAASGGTDGADEVRFTLDLRAGAPAARSHEAVVPQALIDAALARDARQMDPMDAGAPPLVDLPRPAPTFESLESTVVEPVPARDVVAAHGMWADSRIASTLPRSPSGAGSHDDRLDEVLDRARGDVLDDMIDRGAATRRGSNVESGAPPAPAVVAGQPESPARTGGGADAAGASTISSQGALRETRGAAVPGAPSIAYPELARRLGEEGRVVCRLSIRADGVVNAVEVIRSSGYARLDEAARLGLLGWTCTPALEDGVAVAGEVEHAVVFRLDAAS